MAPTEGAKALAQTNELRFGSTLTIDRPTPSVASAPPIPSAGEWQGSSGVTCALGAVCDP